MSDNSESHVLYCTYADSDRYVTDPINPDDFLREIKLNALLADRIYISSGHIFDASHTKKVLFENPSLLDTGIITIGLQEKFRDFNDQYQSRSDDRMVSHPEEKMIAKWLDDNVNNITRWQENNEQPLFKSSLIAVLGNPNSFLRRRLTATYTFQVEALLDAIIELPENEVTRSRLKHIAYRYIPHRIHAFMKEVNALYYTIGSFDLKLIPLYQPSLFKDFNKGMIETVEAKKPIIENAKLFNLITDHTSLRKDILDTIDTKQLSSFISHNDSLLRSFRDKWWNSIGLYNSNSSFLSEELNTIINDIMGAEIKRSNKYDKWSKIISTSALVISAASLIPSPILSALSLVFSIVSHEASQNSVKGKLIDTPFLSLCNELGSQITHD